MDATNAAMINAFAGSSGLDAVRTEPMTQISGDYSGFPGYPTLPIIDLTTMKVLHADCWDQPGSGMTKWKNCIDLYY